MEAEVGRRMRHLCELCLLEEAVFDVERGILEMVGGKMNLRFWCLSWKVGKRRRRKEGGRIGLGRSRFVDCPGL